MRRSSQLDTARYFALRPIPRLAEARVVERGPSRDSLEIALTFDDGPSEWTTEVLDELAAYGVRATFFVIGEAALQREATLHRVAAEHEIGNHSLRHLKLNECESQREVEAEIRDAAEVIRDVVGERPRVFRPPGFACNARVRRAALACGYGQIVNASVWTDDFNQEGPEAIYGTILTHAKLFGGAIINLHDGRAPSEPPLGNGGATRNDRLPTVAALRTIVPTLLERGYKLVTVTELLSL